MAYHTLQLQLCDHSRHLRFKRAHVGFKWKKLIACLNNSSKNKIIDIISSAIFWETMNESVKILKHITKRVNVMKILWGAFEYQQKKMEHGFIPASQKKMCILQ